MILRQPFPHRRRQHHQLVDITGTHIYGHLESSHTTTPFSAIDTTNPQFRYGFVRHPRLCRFHHLLKTFWNDVEGWRDRQVANGTIIWNSPTGHTYITYPARLHLFPTLCQPTATLWTGETPIVENTGQARGARAVM